MMSIESRADLRQRLICCDPQDAPKCLARMLEAGGLSLANDEELLAHVDFWIAYDPLGFQIAEVLSDDIASGRAGGSEIVIQWASGRIRDRVRAAYVLGTAQGIERSSELLEGLLRDSVPIVWLAAARALWRRAHRLPTLFEQWERYLTGVDKALPEVSLRRHAAGGLASLIPLDPVRARPLLELAIDKTVEQWTRHSVAIACAEAAVLMDGSDDGWSSQLFEAVCEMPKQSVEALPSLALGLRNAGRHAQRRSAALRFSERIRARALSWDPSNSPERLACFRAIQLVDGLKAPGVPEDPLSMSFSAGLERVIAGRGLVGNQAEGRTQLANSLGSVLRRAQERLEESREWIEAEHPDEYTSGAAEFSEVTRLVLGEELLPIVIEVMAGQVAPLSIDSSHSTSGEERCSDRDRELEVPTLRADLLRAANELCRTAVSLAFELCRFKQFSTRREGARAVALASNGHFREVRGQLPLLFRLADDSRTRLHGVGALARLLARLRVGDPEGFLELVLRLAMHSGGKRTVLKRVTEASPRNDSRSFLAFIERAAAIVERDPGAAELIRLVERLERAAINTQPWLSSRGASIQNLTLEGLSGLAVSLHCLLHGGAQRTIDGLPLAFEVIGRFERRLSWSEPLPPELQSLIELARGLAARDSFAATLTTQELRTLADGLEKATKSFLARATIRVLRVVARKRKKQHLNQGKNPFDPRSSQTLHGYKVVRMLNMTELSMVMLGIHAETRARVLLKLPSPLIINNEDSLRAFIREGQLLRQVPPEHVVRVHEVMRGDPPKVPPMLVLEFLRGQMLTEHLGKPWQWAVERSLHVLRGLQNVHECGIVHRDVKPENVMVLASGRAVLIDFGIADFSIPKDGPPNPKRLSGTPSHMSPEQWFNLDVSWTTDIYALGVTLYELLSGRLPFDAKTMEEYRRKHATEAPPPLPSHLPPSLHEIVGQMLSKDSEERPDHGAIRLALEEALARGVVRR